MRYNLILHTLHTITSSLLEPRLSRAMGLLGALLIDDTASGAELDWGSRDSV